MINFDPINSSKKLTKKTNQILINKNKKPMKKFLMIAAMAMVATVACGEKDPINNEKPPVPGAPKATIVAAPTSVAIAAAGAFNVTLDKAAAEDVTIAVAGGADFLTIAAAEIKITKGATTGTVAFTGKAAGSAKVTFSTTSTAISLETKELTVTVTTDVIPPAEYEFPTSGWGTYFGMSKVVIGATTLTSSCGDGIDSETGLVAPDKPLTGEDMFGINGVSDDKTGTIVPLTEGIAYTIFVDNYTSTKDKGDVFFYIDWNGNGTFEEATELIKVEKAVSGAKKTELTGTITIPAGAVASSRGRIIVANEDNDIENGVGAMDSGYMMDFKYSK